MSNEAISNENHAQRIVYLRKEIKANQRRVLISFSSIIFGFLVLTFLSAYMYGEYTETVFYFAVLLRGLRGLNLYIEVVLGTIGVILVVLGFVLGLYVLIHAGNSKKFEEEFAKIATKEDWMNKDF